MNPSISIIGAGVSGLYIVLLLLVFPSVGVVKIMTLSNTFYA